MTRDADNDNPSLGPGRSTEAAQSWENLSDGNAALADQPVPQLSERLSSVTADDPAMSEPFASEQSTQLVEQTASEQTQVALSAADVGTSVVATTGVIPSSHAIPINVLGIEMPHRPIPAARSTALQHRAPQARAQRQSPSTEFGKQGSEHLFNRPPNAAGAQAEPSPMEQAINAKPRKPLTAQPGFVGGLVAALVCGGALYGYLVF